MRRVEVGQLGGHRVRDVREQGGVEPKVRVDVAVVVAQLDHVGDVEDAALGVLLDRFVDGGLEAVLDDHKVGAREGDRTGECRLDVVRLHTRVGQADHADVGAADTLGDPRERVEAGRHLHPVVVGRQRRAPREGDDEQEGGEPTHENDSHQG